MPAKDSSTNKVSLIFFGVFVLNFSLSLAKIFGGISIHNLTLLADGFHSALDVLANIISFLASKIAYKQPDKEHPYGHRKFEALAAIIISFFMFFACFEIISQCIDKFTNPNKVVSKLNSIGFTIAIISITINLIVIQTEKYYGNKLQNNLLLADAKHTLSDVLTSIIVLISLFATQIHIPNSDIIFSIMLVIFILKSGYEIILENLDSLVDAAILDTAEIEKIVMQTEGVVACHNIRSRGMKDYIFLDLNIHVRPNISISQAHKISENVENKLKSSIDYLKDVIVHIEDHGHK